MTVALDGLTVARWYHAMCQRNQPPVLIDFGVERPSGRRCIQVKVFGRDYEDADRELWQWMRRHDAEVRAYLQGLGAWRYGWGGRVRPIGTASGVTPAQEAAAIIAAAERARLSLTVWMDRQGRERISANTPLVGANLEPLPEPFCDEQAWQEVIVPGIKKLRPIIADLLWQSQAERGAGEGRAA